MVEKWENNYYVYTQIKLIFTICSHERKSLRKIKKQFYIVLTCVHILVADLLIYNNLGNKTDNTSGFLEEIEKQIPYLSKTLPEKLTTIPLDNIALLR